MPSRSLLNRTDIPDIFTPGNWRRSFPDLAIYAEANELPAYANDGCMSRDETINLAGLVDAAAINDPDEPAQAWEACCIPNGDWVVECASETFYFRTYTVLNGTLAGKRVVKRREGVRGAYKGFAFITKMGELRMWRSHEQDADEKYVKVMRTAMAKAMRLNMDRLMMDEHRTGYQRSTLAHAEIGEQMIVRTTHLGTIRFTIEHACQICNLRDQHARTSGDTPISFCYDHRTIVPDPSEAQLREAERIERETAAERNLSRLPLCELGTGEVR